MKSHSAPLVDDNSSSSENISADKKITYGHSSLKAAGGFFDLQINGFAGIDFQQADLAEADLTRAIAALSAFGTSRIFFTVITDEIDRLCRKLEAVEKMCRRNPQLAEVIAGYHVEGPWLLPEPGFCGMHDARLMRHPSVREFDLLMEAAAGRIRLLTLAPELPDSPEVIARAVAGIAGVRRPHQCERSRH